ncbi:hypothetical protein [Bacillus sp. FJAT-26390]|uniref:hypothetical protein n=1 Tax=Bacillus sp. FJAT-26390 TaxID=1743142 RepID=UPI000807EBFD|nr:hypothetical protein [Bacillus sp. FJAT-26390]OBZ08546.1 hypothetical protein A7975_26015 [Bacillus sp. FJAT-26390]
MPDTAFDQEMDKSADSSIHSSSMVSKAELIDAGLTALNELGADHICKVCIANSGSCCNGCQHLLDGVGCQKRNTSCTAWLCGFHKFLLYEVGELEQWNAFWNQVPGQDYREDFTPEHIKIEKKLRRQKFAMDHLGEALAADLQEMARSHISIGLILALREKLDKNIDQLMNGDDDHKKKARLKRKIKVLTSDFQRFHYLLAKYQEQLSSDITP